MTIAFQGMPISATNFSEANQQLKNVSFKQDIFHGFDNLNVDKFQHKEQKRDIFELPKISFLRLQFNRLTAEQVEAVNNTKILPKNAKFTELGGKISIKWNIANITKGTHKLPQGYEVKNDRFGFTHVVREGTQGWLFKNSIK